MLIVTKYIHTVGGAVRDSLLGITPSDIDYVAVGYTPQELLDTGATLIGRDFPVFLSTSGSEIALARTERKVASGTMGFHCETQSVTLEQDLYRRDLTINSMALSPTGSIIDPCGGQQDIESRILRHTSSAFVEDPVRVLRLARFYAKYTEFTIHSATKALVYSMRSELATLQPDRVWAELRKVLALPNPQRFFEALLSLQVLDVIFPSMFNLVNLFENSTAHGEASVFNHSMWVLRLVSVETTDTSVRLAALYHDIAKPLAYQQHGNSSGHEDHPLLEHLIDSDIQLPSALRKKLLFLIRNHVKIYKLHSMKSTSIAKYLYQYKSPAILKRQLILAHADDEGRICTRLHKTIDDSAIISAVLEISSYSPALWIQTEEPASPEHIKQHIHRVNIGIVRKYFD